jgi:excisionase family DNA binding protein
MSEELLCTVVDAARRLSLSRANVYKILARGSIRSVSIGRSRRVVVASLREYVAQLEDVQRCG